MPATFVAATGAVSSSAARGGGDHPTRRPPRVVESRVVVVLVPRDWSAAEGKYSLINITDGTPVKHHTLCCTIFHNYLSLQWQRRFLSAGTRRIQKLRKEVSPHPTETHNAAHNTRLVRRRRKKGLRRRNAHESTKTNNKQQYTRPRSQCCQVNHPHG